MKICNLVVAPIKKTWDKNKTNILLGEWCLPFKDKEKFINYKFDFINNKHRWFKFSNFEKDFIYLEKLSEKIVKELSKDLNLLHEKNYNSVFWKIYLKNWVTIYTQLVFDRWLATDPLKNKKFKFNKAIFLNRKISLNTKDFKFLAKEHFWNYEIFSKIIFYRFKKNILISPEKKFKTYYLKSRYWNYKKNKKHLIKNFFVKLINSFFFSKSKILIFDAYLSNIERFLLSFKSNSFGIGSYFITEKKFNPNYSSRRKLLKNFNCKNNFEKFLIKNLALDMPFIFLEDFKNKLNFVNNLNWPQRPKLIFTSHGINDDIFNLYLALKKKNGAKLLIGQHGGGYFQFKFSSNENFEKEICDYYLGWGKKNSFKKKHIDFGILKPLQSSYGNDKDKKLLTIIVKQGEFYLQRLLSNKRLFMHREYVNDIINIISKINLKLKKNILLRTHAKHNYGDYFIFKKNFLTKNINIEDGNRNIFKIYKKSKVVFHTYAITGYLETLALNIPTIVFHDLKKYPVDNTTLKHLKRLKGVKIFFDDYNKAVDHLNKNWENIEHWWQSNKVQKERIRFGKFYGHFNKNNIKKLSQILNKLS